MHGSAATPASGGAVAGRRLGQVRYPSPPPIHEQEKIKDTAQRRVKALREVMAPQALHWQAIQDAKFWGYTDYECWGVAPEGAEDHAWAGITRFKRGFGGRYVSYPGTYDLPLDRFWYTVYAFARRFRF